MCGRFTLNHTWPDIHAMYNLIRPEDICRNVPARYNIAPTQDVLFVNGVGEERQLLEGRWWLVPHWAKEIPKYTLFNARSEDAYKKPSFRDAFKTRRCLIPADGYYEWTKGKDGGKDPHYIHLPNNEPFAFAGLSAYNTALEITSCTILTAAATDNIKDLHHRMPIIIPPRLFDDWLALETDVEHARKLLTDNCGADLQSYRVSRNVNSSRAQGEDLICVVE